MERMTYKPTRRQAVAPRPVRCDLCRDSGWISYVQKYDGVCFRTAAKPVGDPLMVGPLSPGELENQYPYPIWMNWTAECECKRAARGLSRVETIIRMGLVPRESIKFDWADFGEGYMSAPCAALMQLSQHDACEYKGIVKPGVFLAGTKGAGKTTLAFRAAREWVRRAKSVEWVRWPDAVGLMRESYGEGGDGVPAHLLQRKYEAAEALIVDELGSVTRANQWGNDAIDMLTGIMERRFNLQKPTVLISNNKIEELEVQFGSTALSRIKGLAHVIPMIGADMRPRAGMVQL